jgi:hypothetical protein
MPRCVLGDKLCLLEGLKDPIVLREVKGSGITYWVVGGVFLRRTKLDKIQAKKKVHNSSICV